jgi:hypothetical protein
MSCVHLRQLYQLCQTSNIRITGADLVHMVCRECGVQDVCPAMLMEEYDATHPDEAAAAEAGKDAATGKVAG